MSGLFGQPRTQEEQQYYDMFRRKQYAAPRVRGTMNRNKYYWDILMGRVERGTRAKGRRNG